MVELMQGFKIRYTKKQQYLSDFFELLLTTGLILICDWGVAGD